MIATEANPIVFDRRQRQCLSSRLILAHLEDDRDISAFYRDLVKTETGLSDEAFLLADELAATYARTYRTPESRENARVELTQFLDRQSR